MKKQIAALGLFTAIVFGNFSCTKDNTDANPPKTQTELLTQGTWKFKMATSNGVDISNQNPPFEPCKKDNILSFSANGAGVMNEGATKCNASDPDNVNFTWTFFNNNTGLRISTPLWTNGNTDFTLESLTETELTISQGYSPPVGATFLVKVTFQH